jgi:hypothetical protein
MTAQELTAQPAPEGEAIPCCPRCHITDCEHRPHISQQQYSLIWQHLDTVYGHHCYAEGCTRTDVQVDHKDGNRWNTVLSNLQPACPRHQQVRAVARERRRGGVGEANVHLRPTDEVSRDVSYETRAHRAEKPFRNWVVGYLVQNGGGPLSEDWFVTNGAEIFDVMQVTTGRWMEKLRSDSGPLKKSEDVLNKRTTIFVTLKPEYWAKINKEYWNGPGAEYSGPRFPDPKEEQQ